jgi:sugar lactone lactonase YvrE
MATPPDRVDHDLPGRPSTPRTVGTTLAHHGEGPVWDDADGTLLWVDIAGRCVHRTAPDGTTRSVGTPDDVGAVAPYAPGGVLAAVGRSFVRLELPTGGITPIAGTPEGDGPALRMNDGGVDPAGRFWAGTMARDGSPEAGTLYRLDADGSAPAVLDGISVANGPVWSPDGTTMYFTDTPTGLIRGYAYDAADGTLGANRVVVDTEGFAGDPDGMTVDSEGNLWVAFWDGWAVRCFSPVGDLLDVIEFPVARPTRPAWGGADRRTLYVTTSRIDLPAEDLAAQPLAGRLFAVEPRATGVVPPPAAALA